MSAPADLGASASLWEQLTSKYEMRGDELRMLEDACREMDLVDGMELELQGGQFMSTGSMGQPVIHPLVAEIRQHRNVIAALLRGLKLPDDGAGDAVGAKSAQARSAANARWAKPA